MGRHSDYIIFIYEEGKKREGEGRRGKKREEEGSEVKVVKIGKGRGLPIDGERP